MEVFLPFKDLKKCCSCGCSCSFVNSSGTWIRSVKRKCNEFEEGTRICMPELKYFPVARVEIENECAALREMVSSHQKAIADLVTELEEERNASSSAANETMSMILKLQREKAEIQMEARQFKRFAEEKMAHDQDELCALEDMLYNREQNLQSLSCEVQEYKHKMMSYGLIEADADVEGERNRFFHNQRFTENVDEQFEFPSYEYPPLKCNLMVIQGPLDSHEVVDIEKYPYSAFHDDCLENLDYRIHEMERFPINDQLDVDSSTGKSISEKVVVGQSPRQSSHSRKFSTDRSNLLLPMSIEMVPDLESDSPKHNGSSIEKMEYISQTEDLFDMGKLDNVSKIGDDTMIDRVYTIDSVHNDVPYSDITESKAGVGICEDYPSNPRESLNQVDAGDYDIKKLHTRLQALEADRESMRQTIISMRTDNAQLVLLKEIAKHLCKDMSPERRMPLKKTSLIQSFSFMSIFKWIMSLIFWRKKGRQSKVVNMCNSRLVNRC